MDLPWDFLLAGFDDLAGGWLAVILRTEILFSLMSGTGRPATGETTPSLKPITWEKSNHAGKSSAVRNSLAQCRGGLLTRGLPIKNQDSKNEPGPSCRACFGYRSRAASGGYVPGPYHDLCHPVPSGA
jgi:hypothetical protein